MRIMIIQNVLVVAAPAKNVHCNTQASVPGTSIHLAPSRTKKHGTSTMTAISDSGPKLVSKLGLEKWSRLTVALRSWKNAGAHGN